MIVQYFITLTSMLIVMVGKCLCTLSTKLSINLITDSFSEGWAFTNASQSWDRISQLCLETSGVCLGPSNTYNAPYNKQITQYDASTNYTYVHFMALYMHSYRYSLCLLILTILVFLLRTILLIAFLTRHDYLIVNLHEFR
jgi:hypothetical protein